MSTLARGAKELKSERAEECLSALMAQCMKASGAMTNCMDTAATFGPAATTTKASVSMAKEKDMGN